MTNLKTILFDYLYFIIVFAVFLVALFIFIIIINKKNSKNSIYLSGLLMNLKQNEILSLSIILINYLLLIYTMAMNIKLTYTIALIYVLLILISFVLVNNATALIINGIINTVNVGFIYLANLVNVLKHNNSGDIKYLLLQVLMMVFGILFYTFTTCKFIKDIRKKEKK